MSSDSVLRLVVIDDDLNDAEKIISTIKSSGFAIRPKRAEDREELLEALEHHAPDMVLHSLDSQSIDLEQTIACIREAGKHLPVIALTPDDGAKPAEYLRQGAEDLVSKEDLEHLQLVVTRTAKAHRQWRELKKLEGAVRESEKRCRMLLDSSRDSICYVHEGMHVYANPTYLELFGYSDLEDIEGTPIMDMVAHEHQQAFKDFLRNIDQASKADQSLDITLRDAQDETFDAKLEFSPASIDGEPCTQIVIRGRTDDQELKQRDLATGLYNRKHFVDELETAINKATQGEHKSAVIQFNIRNMADIRSALGVAAIDLVVADTAKLLAEQGAEGELLARFSEDSFIVLTPAWENEAIRERAGEFLSVVNEHIFDLEGKSCAAELCAGAAQIDENAPDANQILVRAEKALEQAKGQDERFVLYVPQEEEMTQRQRDQVWVKELEQAIQDNRFRLFFQPIVSLHGDPGQRYEVFLRLENDAGEIVPAREFMPSTERTGIGSALDRWLLESALSRLAEVRQADHDTSFFVKLTAGSLQDPDLLPWLAEHIKKYRVPPASLVFEIKETIVVTHLKQAKQFVKGLKEIHCQCAMDDFGTGLNPFQLVKAVPMDYLKIDNSLMENISTNTENQEAVRTITDTAHSMNRVTVAPFVEDAGALSVLWGMGVNYIQGDFLQEASERMDYDFSAMG